MCKVCIFFLSSLLSQNVCAGWRFFKLNLITDLPHLWRHVMVYNRTTSYVIYHSAKKGREVGVIQSSPMVLIRFCMKDQIILRSPKHRVRRIFCFGTSALVEKIDRWKSLNSHSRKGWRCIQVVNDSKTFWHRIRVGETRGGMIWMVYSTDTNGGGSPEVEILMPSGCRYLVHNIFKSYVAINVWEILCRCALAT
jgi:hypothetical protein